MRLSLILASLALSLGTSGCFGLSIGGRTETVTTPEKRSAKISPKDFDLSPKAEAAFLADPEVTDAMRNIDLVSSEETLGYRNAIRTLERRAAHFRAAYPKSSFIDAPSH